MPMRVQPMQGTSTDPLVAGFACSGRRGGVTGVTERGRSGKRKVGTSSCFALITDLRGGSAEVRKGEQLPTYGSLADERGGPETRPELLDLREMLGIPIAGLGSIGAGLGDAKGVDADEPQI